jgi:hypothetical protein
VIDVVEIDPADGERLQIVDSGGLRNFLSERRVLRPDALPLAIFDVWEALIF